MLNYTLLTCLRTNSWHFTGGAKSEAYNSTIGRRSILECDINPYELVSSTADAKQVESGITLVNGQRIRVRPSLMDKEYEDVQIKKSPKSNCSSNCTTPVLSVNKRKIPEIKVSELSYKVSAIIKRSLFPKFLVGLDGKSNNFFEASRILINKGSDRTETFNSNNVPMIVAW